MRIYLDNCCFNRPYDNQNALIIRLETEAKLQIQHMVKAGALELVWSFILDYENAANPFDERREQIACWRGIAKSNIQLSPDVAQKAAGLMKSGLRQKDAAHIACAVAAKSDYFITTDKKILNKRVESIALVNPIDFLRGYGDV